MAAAADRLPALRVPEWEAIPNLVHGFLGRRGGASGGPFAELNLSYRVGDAAEAVRENWRRVGVETRGLRYAPIHQVHGDRVVTINDGDVEGGEADASVTQASATSVGVLTADCVPILLVAPRHRVAAAVHAGWRGTLAGVLRRAVQHIEHEFHVPAVELHAALGPSIDGCCYEVDEAVADALEERWGPPSVAVRREPAAKPRVDLRLLNTAILRHAGIRPTHITNVGPCTRCTTTQYFSHRASNGATGRQWSFIGWHA